MSTKIFSPSIGSAELAWEAEFDRCLAPKKRGAKRASVSQLLGISAWLDDELCWHEGQVCFRRQNHLRALEGATIRRTGRALQALDKKGAAPEVVARRQTCWEWVAPLLEVQAPDLVSLCALSRRSNPAAIRRLKLLLAVEALSSTPLEASPARALVKAWPLSRPVLLELCNQEGWPAQVRALAALCLSAAGDITEVPHAWRRVTSRACGVDWVEDERLEPALVASGALEGQGLVWRYVALVQSKGLIPVDNVALRAEYRANGIVAALNVGEAVTQLCDFWPAFPEIATICDIVALNQGGYRYDEQQVKIAQGQWRSLRRTVFCETASFWWELARRDTAAVPAAARCLQVLLKLPVHAMVSARPAKKQKKTSVVLLTQILTLCATALEQWWPIAMKWLREATDCDMPREVLELAQEVAKGHSMHVPVLRHHTACPVLFVEDWMGVVQPRFEAVIAPAINLARRVGPDVAHEAWKRHALYAIQFDWPSGKWAQAALHLVSLGGTSMSVVSKLFRRLHAFENASHAQRWIDRIGQSTSDWSPEARHDLFDTILSHPFTSAAKARASLEQFPQYLDILSETLHEWPQGVYGGSELVMALVEEVPEGRLAPENLRPFVQIVLQKVRACREEGLPDQLSYLACLAASVCDTPEQFGAVVTRLWGGLERDWDDWDASWRVVKGMFSHRPLMRAIRLAVDTAPDRTLTALSHLGTLERIKALGRVDLSLLGAEVPPVAADKRWRDVLEIDSELAVPAQEWRHWAHTAKQEISPPRSVIKVLEWPCVWRRETEALRLKMETMADAAGERRERCQKRLQNLEARLADVDGTHRAMSEEIRETLCNLTCSAALNVLEALVAQVLGAQLQALCGAAAREVELDGDLLNAFLLACEVESNRKWARQILRQHFEGNKAWRELLPGNVKFLEGIRARGIAPAVFLARFERQYGDWTFWLEDEPLGVLQMGNRFNTCLSRNGCNAHSSIANAIDLNKRVAYARDRCGHIIGRQLWALSTEGKLVGFWVYSTLPKTVRDPLQRAFTAYAREFASVCGVELSDEGEVENLVVSSWYDDGLAEWETKEEEVCQTVAST